jgi:hypothetical protein
MWIAHDYDRFCMIGGALGLSSQCSVGISMVSARC